MLIKLRINNCLIFDSEVEFSMKANLHLKKFPNNYTQVGSIPVLKSAILFGPNNTGKTNMVRAIETVQDVLLNRKAEITPNIFSANPVCEFTVWFWEDGAEYLFEVRYDAEKHAYLYERFAQVTRDGYGNEKETDWLIRDNENQIYRCADDKTLEPVMPAAATDHILVYLVNPERYEVLNRVKTILVSFALKIDIVDMNNIPIKKTIDLLKAGEMREKIANFVRNADLSLEDFRYLSNAEMQQEMPGLEKTVISGFQTQEKAMATAAPILEMLHLGSVYNGCTLPSVFFDSTGTKKVAALASYVLDALNHGRVLVVDELDNSLHFKLTREIIALFNNELNTNAQLIATVHDVSLLDCKTLFRKDQIWFTHKDQAHAYLYSLADFTAEKDGVRDSTDLIEKYRSGCFGALPDPDLFQSLLEVKQNAESSAN